MKEMACDAQLAPIGAAISRGGTDLSKTFRAADGAFRRRQCEKLREQHPKTLPPPRLDVATISLETPHPLLNFF
jgi:hypothetical protein